jgi:hypothetical protein
VIEPETAKARFVVLSALRLLSAFAVAGGMILAFGERALVREELELPIGISLIVIGFVTLLAIVPALTRRWRTPR